MRTIYQCQSCGKTSIDPSEIIACEGQPTEDVETPLAVGDVVSCGYPATAHWDHDPAWAIWRDSDHRFLNGYQPLWVVAAKIVWEHRWQYILWSPERGVARTSNWHHEMIKERTATDEELERAQTHPTVFDVVVNPDRLSHHMPLA